uniref:FAD-dependent oxidoreductase n=1 Tax=Ndongobacter massiliensis TaxID=1871025 RepID=UPI00093134A1|nr:FAD-dependent oxidoreductase [Ndongobacter massiliensis]
MQKEERICIVGGGPAGTSAAMYLEKNGYYNYTIYEKNDKVGGKCRSPLMKVKNKDGEWEDRTIEMGAVMGCDTYFAVQECEEFGHTTHKDGPPMGRVFMNTDGTKLKTSKIALLKKLWALRKMTKLLNTKYKGYDVNGHRGVAEGRYEGPCPSPEMKLAHIEGENPNLKDLSMPFIDFLRLNKCEDAMLVWKGPFTSFGYGYFDEIPAAYVLKYLDAFTVRQFLRAGLLWTWKDGTQSIWQGVNDHLKHPVVLNTEVNRIERKENKVYVTVTDQGGERTEEFDKLIICTPLELFMNYGDAREDEKDLFSKIVHKKYFTMAVRTAEDNTPDISYYYFQNMTVETRGHLMVFYHRWPDCGPQPLVTFTLRNHKDHEDVPFEVAKQTTLDDMAKSGLPVEKIERIDDWYYFPHVNSEDYAAGWYDKVEAMQGKDNTYYAGEVMAYGDMEETVEYSRDLVRRFFTA